MAYYIDFKPKISEHFLETNDKQVIGVIDFIKRKDNILIGECNVSLVSKSPYVSLYFTKYGNDYNIHIVNCGRQGKYITVVQHVSWGECKVICTGNILIGDEKSLSEPLASFIINTIKNL